MPRGLSILEAGSDILFLGIPTATDSLLAQNLIDSYGNRTELCSGRQ